MSKKVPPRKKHGRPPDAQKAGATFGIRGQYNHALAQPGNEKLSRTAFAMGVAIAQCVALDQRDAVIHLVWEGARRGGWTRKRLDMAVTQAAYDQASTRRRLLESVRSRFDTLMQELKTGLPADPDALEQHLKGLRAEAESKAPPPCNCRHHHCRNPASPSHSCGFVAPEGEEISVRCFAADRHDMAPEACSWDHHHCAKCGAGVCATSKPFLYLEKTYSPLLEKVRQARWLCGYCRDALRATIADTPQDAVLARVREPQPEHLPIAAMPASKTPT